MQQILSVDCSTDTVQAVLLELDGKSLKVVERHSIPCGAFFSRENLLRHQNGDGSGAAQAGDAETQDGPLDGYDNPLKKLLSGVSAEWTSSIILIPGYDYLSLNLDLPFTDQKTIAKVLPLEVQDLIPFDLSEFLVQHQRVDLSAGSSSDVHVGLIPKDYLRGVLRVCRDSALEPLIITTPASALGALYHLAPDYFAPDSAIISIDPQFIYVCVSVKGIVRTERISRRMPAPTDRQASRDETAQELKLTLSAFESRYGVTFEKVYFFCTPLSDGELQQKLGRRVERIQPSDLVAQGDLATGLACFAGVFVRDYAPPPVLTNFRSGEFAYRPRLDELLQGLRRLLPYFLAALLSAFLLVTLTFLVRERRIAKLDRTVREQVLKTIPEGKIPADRELATLIGINRTLENQLDAMGSPIRLSPLDYLVYLSEDLARAFERAPGMDVTKIKITTSRATVEGTASDYAEVENIKRVLRRRKKVYCDLNQSDTRSVRGTGRGFKFELELCD